MAKFDFISRIDPDAASSWEGKFFLTFDIDWASDAVLHDTLDLLERTEQRSTWFVTHDTPVLTRLRANPHIELGIHPNFNFLLQGDARNGADASEVIDRLLALVPEAKAVRSHSMTQSTPLLDLFVRKGLTHDANHFIPAQSGIALRPWRAWNGLIKIPYGWEDDLHCIYGSGPTPAQLRSAAGLQVVDFHPIHVFLNTEHLSRYEGARAHFADVQALASHRGDAPHGARHLLSQLLEAA